MIVETNVSRRLQAALQEVSDGENLSAPGQTPSPATLRRPIPANLAPGAAQELMDASFEALDLLNIGLVVCNAFGQPLLANQTAGAILKNRDGLEVDSNGVLSATEAQSPDLSELIERIANAAQTENPYGHDAAVAVPRSLGRRALTLLVRSANRGRRQPQDRQGAAVLVMITDAALPVRTNESELQQLYGLTATESRIAKLLMEGKDLDNCCEELGICRSTVRMHRRNLFSKIGVRRQTQLIALLLKSIGLGPREK